MSLQAGLLLGEASVWVSRLTSIHLLRTSAAIYLRTRAEKSRYSSVYLLLSVSPLSVSVVFVSWCGAVCNLQSGDGRGLSEHPNYNVKHSAPAFKWRLVIAYDGTHYAGSSPLVPRVCFLGLGWSLQSRAQIPGFGVLDFSCTRAFSSRIFRVFLVRQIFSVDNMSSNFLNILMLNDSRAKFC